jgi:hypothetical protein
MRKALEIAEKEYMAEASNADVINNYKGTLETLKNIYFRVRTVKEEYKTSLDEVEAKLKSL